LAWSHFLKRYFGYSINAGDGPAAVPQNFVYAHHRLIDLGVII